MRHFFVPPEQVSGDEICIMGTDVNHIRNVLRMRPGEQLEISDGSQENYICRIKEFEEDKAVLTICERLDVNRELPSQLYLFQGLPKGDKMEFIVQKAVELGACAVIPVATRRSVVRLDARKAEKKRQRWQAIAEGGAKQSGRMRIPEVYPVMSFPEALDMAKELDICLIPYELAEGMEETRKIIDGVRPGQSAGIFIGPEGGFEIAEVEAAVRMGAKPLTLGKRILRTETAGLALLSVLMFRLEQE
ncbi:MAG TPA: 16S rRNA (uracil(1498)-N(3))-methyltransferase [Lachnospiraceae bacterium]|nr:16S rRNA (uracil(1498)-N(3))-methyltransferase [Lachnospiraceae bacterium]